MKILISVDIEGVAGVFHPEQTQPGNPEYERARQWMSDEADAAIKGAYDGGATEVIVNDSHGSFRNLLAQRLDARAHVLLGKPRPLGMMAGLELGCHAVVMVGYHARARSSGLLAHTINSQAFSTVYYNGQEVGEVELYAAVAAEHRAPVLLVSGDDVLARQTQGLMPLTRFLVTKQALGFQQGLSLSTAQSCAQLRTATAELVQARRGQPQPPAPAPGPHRCQLHTQSPVHADLFALLPSVERLDATTVTFDGATALEMVRTLNALSAMALSLR